MTRRLEVAGTAVDPGDGRRDQRVGFAYLDDRMDGFGDGRARELTSGSRASIGA
jgi:hypothetical protein